jgi:hypothetical protein
MNWQNAEEEEKNRCKVCKTLGTGIMSAKTGKKGRARGEKHRSTTTRQATTNRHTHTHTRTEKEGILDVQNNVEDYCTVFEDLEPLVPLLHRSFSLKKSSEGMEMQRSRWRWRWRCRDGDGQNKYILYIYRIHVQHTVQNTRIHKKIPH